MKKNLAISCILLAVVTIFSLYFYQERETKSLPASIEPYTETAVILSDYIDFEKAFISVTNPTMRYYIKITLITISGRLT